MASFFGPIVPLFQRLRFFLMSRVQVWVRFLDDAITHQRRFSLVSSLGKTYQKLVKNVSSALEKSISDDLPEKLQNMRNSKQSFQLEKFPFYSKFV